MSRRKRFTSDEVVECTYDDIKVQVALKDVVSAILTRGPEAVSMDHLKSVIEYRLNVWSEYELEEEPIYDEGA